MQIPTGPAVTHALPDRLHLLIHFAGHGFADVGGHLYLTAPDTVVADIAVPALFAALLIDRSPSRRMILIIDCCSGAVSR